MKNANVILANLLQAAQDKNVTAYQAAAQELAQLALTEGAALPTAFTVAERFTESVVDNFHSEKQ